MRRLLLVFMIALLPLRGLVGDAMALAMVPAPAHGVTHAEASSDATPCPDQAANTIDAHAQTGHPAAGAETTGTESHAHGSCELCNGPAMGHALPQAPAGTIQQGIAPGAIERFVSFEPQRGIKPPIS